MNMVLIILAVVCAVVFVGGLIGLAVGPNTESRAGAAAVGLIAAVVGVLAIVCASITTVGTKDVGVVTSFGKPTGRDLPNGIHFKKPWQHVTEMDGAIQPDVYSGKYGIPVRIGDSTTASVDATIRWRFVPDQASVLYQDYRSDDVNKSIRDSLVRTQFNAALNDVLGKYNPLQQVAVVAKNTKAPSTVTSTAPNLDLYSRQVKDSMNQHLVDAAEGTASHGLQQVQVVSVTLQFINLASTTQDKINDFLKEVGATRVAEQREQTTSAQAAANRLLSRSVSHDPNVLVSRCFDTVEEAVKADYTLPAGFSCWSGSGGAVVVPSAGK